MDSKKVVFVAFEEFDNLGIGYLMSVLSDGGFDSLVIDVRDEKEKILATLLNINPLIVGFSVVFQFYIYAFSNLIAYLRKEGINCHFAAGGQYASLKYKELFKIIPELDSIVRFEGEYTFLELVNHINSGSNWRLIKSIAFKNQHDTVATPLRPLEKDLDKFPFPKRSPLKEYAFGKKFSTLIAGRGCVYNCSFCNARKLYQHQTGAIKRLREPEMVVKEMYHLYNKENCSVFLFQDDDFPLRTKPENDWILRFCNELDHKKLSKKILWKINCRPDEISYDSFALLKEKGLFMTFIGIEDGTDPGLKVLNKHLTVEKILKGINILKKLGIGFDFGFMLFQPQSTYKSIQENLSFLSQISDDGFTPVTFLKMLPFFETEVERKLKKEGRLIGKPGLSDYAFLDESINQYYDFFEKSFLVWMRDPNGLLNISRWARNFVLVYTFFFGENHEIKIVSRNVHKLISDSNFFLLEAMKKLAALFESEDNIQNQSIILARYTRNITIIHDQFKRQMISLIKRIYWLAKYHTLMPLNRY